MVEDVDTQVFLEVPDGSDSIRIEATLTDWRVTDCTVEVTEDGTTYESSGCGEGPISDAQPCQIVVGISGDGDAISAGAQCESLTSASDPEQRRDLSSPYDRGDPAAVSLQGCAVF